MEARKSELVVLGAGPGGYAAAFYAADRGKKVLLVDQDKRLGGVCLNRGCIPSKALIHATGVMNEAKESAKRGISFDQPGLDLEKLRAWKESILDRLSQGIGGLAQKRGVEVLRGRGHFR
jgi:dihydrolipoamide dehydrogenase